MPETDSLYIGEISGDSFVKMLMGCWNPDNDKPKENKGGEQPVPQKAIGIKLGQHAKHDDCKNKIYYYLALEDFEVGDTAAVILPGGQMIGVPVVQVLDVVDGNVNGINVIKHAVGKIDDSKYKELNRIKDEIKDRKKAMQRAGYEVRKRIRHIANQKTWADWAQVDVGVLTLIGDYYLAKEKYAEVAGTDEAERMDVMARSKEVIYENETPF